MRLLKRRVFSRWAQDNDIDDRQLRKAAEEIRNGLVDAYLGGFLIKKRIASNGRGKSGGFRVILCYRQGDRLVFMHGFAKNQFDDLAHRDRIALHKLGASYMDASQGELDALIEEGILTEIGP